MTKGRWQCVSRKRDVRLAAEPQWCCSRNAFQRRTVWSGVWHQVGQSREGRESNMLNVMRVPPNTHIRGGSMYGLS